MHGDPGEAESKLILLRRRSKIVEITCADDLVFALSLSGVCAAFQGNERIAYLNTTAGEVIRSLYFNKANESLITVSVYRDENFASLRCRSTPLEYIRRRQPAAGFALFEGECLKWPGFVEFDDVNSKVLTYSAAAHTYSVWEMRSYGLIYRISDEHVTEIKMSPKAMLIIKEREASFVPLRILSIEDGTQVKALSHPLHRTRKVELIELFDEKLLVKQECASMQIVDVKTGATIHVPASEFLAPAAFIFLYNQRRFLTFRHRSVAIWNFRGECVTAFDDHTLWHPDSNMNNIFITTTQDYIISYCKRPEGDERKGGTINISSLLTGKCVGKVAQGEPLHELQDVTTLYYNEQRNALYLGDRNGILRVLAQ